MTSGTVGHDHNFISDDNRAETRSWVVAGVTAAMMVIELVGGWLTNSMAVVADGWHMSTHAAALGIAGAAYLYARRKAGDRRFAFGPWKAEALGGFTSAILLVVVACAMGWQSIHRLFHPLPIHYGEALVIAVSGLAVNVTCAFILKGHGHGHGPEDHAHGNTDLNMKAAYLHVLADAVTSVTAIAALLAARQWHVAAIDPIVGIAGTVLICVWGYGLIRDTSRVLLDREMDSAIVEEIRRTIERTDQTVVSDLHVVRVGREKYACIVAVVTSTEATVSDFREMLVRHPQIAHTTIEITRQGVMERHAMS